MKSMIKMKNVSKNFDGRKVIKQCHISIKEGEIYGFLGANGAGKTTILKLIAGLLQPSEGEVSVMEMTYEKNRKEILRQIGSLIEVPVFYEHLSARENLQLHVTYMDCKEADIDKTLHQVGLSDSSQPVTNYSLGMRQRLAIARAIIHRPRLLLLDEPINGLDPMGIREMRALFLSLAKEAGMTLMISSHILSEIEHIADSVGVIADGVMIHEVRMLELRQKYPDGLENYFFKVMHGEKYHGKIN